MWQGVDVAENQAIYEGVSPGLLIADTIAWQTAWTYASLAAISLEACRGPRRVKV